MLKTTFTKTKANAEIKELIENIKSDDNVLAVYLFGSYLNGREKKESDLDICIIPNDSNCNLNKYNSDLIQVANYYSLPPNMKYHILQKGEKIFIRKKYNYALHKLAFRSIGEYDKYKYFFNKKRWAMVNG